MDSLQKVHTYLQNKYTTFARLAILDSPHLDRANWNSPQSRPPAGLLSRPFAFITDLMDVPPPSTVATGLTSRPYGFYAQPHVLSVSPATASIAASPLALTVEGVGLYDASAAALVDAQGAPLAGATITILDTSADGRTLSATLTLGALTPSTTAIVVVTALDGATIDWSTGTNSLEVVP